MTEPDPTQLTSERDEGRPTPRPGGSFRRAERLTKRLLAVPKGELDARERAWRAARDRTQRNR